MGVPSVEKGVEPPSNAVAISVLQPAFRERVDPCGEIHRGKVYGSLLFILARTSRTSGAKDQKHSHLPFFKLGHPFDALN